MLYMFYVVSREDKGLSSLGCICRFNLLGILCLVSMQECLVNVKFLLSSLVCFAWVVFRDHFITKSCYYQAQIYAWLVICVLATSLFSFLMAVNFFSHTYSSLHSSTTTKLTIKTYLQLISLKKKKKFSQSTIYKSCHFISSCSFRLKKLISIKKKLISIKNNSFRCKMK